MKFNFIPFLALLCTACSDLLPSAGDPQNRTAQLAPLSETEKEAIAMKIWQNECGATLEGLTTWNLGEEFPSFGIGHFIWYPKGFQGRWEESFPQFIRFAQKAGRRDIPTWVLANSDFPIASRDAFQREFSGYRLSSLRGFLANSVALQADFIVAKSRSALPKILATAPAEERQRIASNYHKVAAVPHGTYALIDYVNFKGTGTKASERYRGQGWGLLQVLQEMRDSPPGAPAAREFSAAAKRVLSRRVRNAPLSRGEQRWEAGWHNRCQSYAHPL